MGYDPAHITGGNPGLLGRIGRTCYQRRWLTLFAWIIGVAVLIVLWMGFGAPADNTFTSSDPGQTVLNQHFPRQSGDQLTLAIRDLAMTTNGIMLSPRATALREAGHTARVHASAVANPRFLLRRAKTDWKP